MRKKKIKKTGMGKKKIKKTPPGKKTAKETRKGKKTAKEMRKGKKTPKRSQMSSLSVFSECSGEVTECVKKIGTDLLSKIASRGEALLELLNDKRFDLPTAMERDPDEMPTWKHMDIELTCGPKGQSPEEHIKKEHLKPPADLTNQKSMKNEKSMKNQKSMQLFSAVEEAKAAEGGKGGQEPQLLPQSCKDKHGHYNKDNEQEKTSSQALSGHSSVNLEMLQNLVERHQGTVANLRFFDGMSIPSNKWILGAFKTYIPLTRSYVCDIGMSRIFLSSVFQSFRPTEDQEETFILLKTTSYAKLDQLEGNAFAELNMWREYAMARPQKIYQCATNPGFGDLTHSVLASDDRMKMGIISFTAEMMTGYSTILSTVSEAKDFTARFPKLDGINFYT